MSHKATADKFLDDRGYTGHLIRGQAPYLLLEEAVRNRITSSYYFKEQCFGLNAATLCDRAVQLTCVGGTYNSGQRPTPFLCLIFKMLQLGVEREIVDEYLAQEDFKYLRALAVFYVRLTEEKSEDVYKRLEPYLEDKRKLRRRGNAGFSLTYVDEFADQCLTKERVCATSFWKLVPRGVLEDEERLEERVSPCQAMLDEEEDDNEDGARDHSSGSDTSRSVSESNSGSRSRSRSRGDARSRSRSVSSSARSKGSSQGALPNGNGRRDNHSHDTDMED